MKKFFTLVTVFGAFGISQAQTITPANLPNVGEIWLGFEDTTASLITVTPAGQGQNWDYSSSFVVSDTSGLIFNNVSTAPAYMNAATTFPGSSMVILTDPIDSAAMFVKTNATGLYYDGYYEQGLFADSASGFFQNYVDWNPDRLIIPTPFSFGSTRDHTAKFEINANIPPGISVSIKSYTVQNFEADGTGTLITPIGTLNNILRIKHTTYQIDSTTYTGVPMPPDVDVHDSSATYLFVQENPHCLVMTIDVDPISGQPISAAYYDPTVIVSTNSSSFIPVTAYPNPTKDVIYLNHIQAQSTIQIFDITGKMVYDKNLSDIGSTIKIDVSDMPQGFYFYHIMNSENGNYHQGKIQVVK